MTQEEIIKGNDQLAEMLGYKKIGMKDMYYWEEFPYHYGVSVENLTFHKDWNRLMKVLKFILTELESVTEDMEIWYSLVDQIPDIEKTWKVAVNIATEENKRKKSNKEV